MRAVLIERQGAPVAPNVRVTSDWPDPEPGPGQVLVETEAAALNHLDLWVGRGLPGLDEFPRISGSDGCGRVIQVGSGVSERWLGRRVVLNAAVEVTPTADPEVAPAGRDLQVIGEHGPGTMAERFVAPATNVLDVGDADPVETAAFGLAHLTAWRMIVTRGGLRPGATVLITGIGGGVALACLNIVKHVGGTAIVTSRHASKLERARELGADHTVLDTGSDWSREVRALTGKRGVDLCADSIGKATHLAAIKALARGGVYATCGCTTGPDATTDLARVFWNQLSIVGSTMGDMDEFREVVALFRSGALRPIIDSTHPSDRAGEAYARLESGEQFGKVVVRW